MPLRCWLQDSLLRLYPRGNAVGPKSLRLDAGRNDRCSFQVAIENDSPADALRVSVEAAAPEGMAVSVRRVGFVPMPHHNTQTEPAELDCRGHVPGYVPDPLFEEQEAVAARGETVGFWVSLRVLPECRPGNHSVAVKVRSVAGAGAAAGLAAEPVAELHATLSVHDVLIAERKNFPVTQWFYSDALLDWYGLPGFDRAYWALARAYLEDIAEHGQDTVYVPALTPSLDGVKRPTQLLSVSRSGGTYTFNWTDVRRYIKLARQCGITGFEWPHLFTQWGVRNAIRVYEGQGGDERLLWSPTTGATSSTYERFLAQFLPKLLQFLQKEGLLNVSFFHVSDEPHGDEARANYSAARALLRRLAPWMKTMDALSDITFGREKLTDLPVAGISTARQFVEEGIPCFGYFCCGPRGPYLNRLLDTPLSKIRMSGWLFHRFQLLGFLHWGYNYWYRSQTRELIDPLTESAGGAWPGWAHGDPFLVYPGATGPVDSIRWEIFAESLTDYALLGTLGVDPRGKLLSPLQDFDRFPKSPAWLRRARRGLLAAR
jgi:hypothetical protein